MTAQTTPTNTSSTTIQGIEIDSTWTDTSSNTSNTINLQPASIQASQPQQCNESNIHDNDEKALFHSCKGAYRMSRKSDGEYGSKNPQYEAAARMGAQAAIAYLKAKGVDYDRDASLEYLRENIVRESHRSLRGNCTSYFSSPIIDMVKSRSVVANHTGLWTAMESAYCHS